MTTLLVGIGGTLGVLARDGISRLTLHTEALLWSTVGINIVGSFLPSGSWAASRPSRPSPYRSCWRSTLESPDALRATSRRP